MKNYTRNFAVVAVAASFFWACKGLPERKPNTPPEPDTETGSATEIVFATMVATDIEMMCGFLGEDVIQNHFYRRVTPEMQSGVANGTITAQRDLVDKYFRLAFNNTKCVDGRTRSGSVIIYYDNPRMQSDYYRDYGFTAKVTLTDYKVDGWLVRTVEGKPFIIRNELTTPANIPLVNNPTWSMEGALEFIHPTDPSKNITWDGKLTKVLLNSSDPDVFDPAGQSSINWSPAEAGYYGTVKGETSGNNPYTMEVNSANPMIRDFSCYPSMGGVEHVPQMRAWMLEYHPFVKGIATIRTGTSYERQLYFGNEGDPELPYQCDNSGQILIKGNSYKIDFTY